MKLAASVTLIFLLLLSPAVADATHVVQAGETLYSIARKYGVKLEDLMRDNGIDSASVTKVRLGTRLTIKGVQAADPAAVPPGPTTVHVVQRNETLWGISRAYDIEVQELLALNPGVDAAKLYVGAKLKVPARDQAASGSATAPSGGSPPGATAASPGPSATTSPPPGPALGAPPAVSWPIQGSRTGSSDGHFKHTRIEGKPGDPVVAVASGRVTWVSPYYRYRNVVMIETRTPSARDAYQFWYAGVDDVYVRAGDWVEKGATIARVGVNPADGKAEVFFAVYQGAAVVDHTKLVWQ